MSDPQTNTEIEDVLASIRRLVSDGDASASSPARIRQATVEVPVSAPSPSANTPSAPEKLVLSPDQLIDAPAKRQGVATSEAHAPSSQSAEPEAASEDQEIALSPIFARAPVADMWHLAQSGEETADDSSATTDKDAESAVVETASVGAETQVADAQDARRQLLSTIAELEAAVTSKTDDFEPDGSERTPVVDWAATTSNGAIFGSRAATTRISEVEDATVVEKAEPNVANAEPVSLKPELVEPAAKEEAMVPVKGDVASATTDDDADDIDDGLAQFLNADAGVDEETLRKLVTEIVRQELQGALGERITRNVRKLVRREIYRALASEEFN